VREEVRERGGVPRAGEREREGGETKKRKKKKEKGAEKWRDNESEGRETKKRGKRVLEGRGEATCHVQERNWESEKQ
jgi:hypothetical protein